MVTLSTPELLHITGYLTGATLYAMLLSMVVRTRGGSDRLTLATAVLGLTWNVGELAAHALTAVHLPAVAAWMEAGSYGALGLLAAATVHSAGAAPPDHRLPKRTWWRAVLGTMYLCAAIAAIWQLDAAAARASLPAGPPLVLLTAGLALVAFPLLVLTHGQAHSRRAMWMTALALFAVSALHLSRFHGSSESWPRELLGHHASIPLAFAILYQDFRFALADLFLKRAITLLVVVMLVVGSWGLLSSTFFPDGRLGSDGVVILLATWVGSALIVPTLHRVVGTFVDRTILARAGSATVVEELTAAMQRAESPGQVLSLSCEILARAVGAAAVTWREVESAASLPPGHIAIPTSEAPHYVLSVGRLAGGRRLLSDDTTMLERSAFLLARRIDGMRITAERYDRMLREQEISTLATEAELRALRAQINPHFLFNTLTTLGYLIQHAPTRAVDTLMRLTTLLRSVLHSEREFTTLGHERELIACYLGIEAERFEERLSIQIDIPDSLAHLEIPSLIVQPLVENAVKHGIAPARAGGHVSVTAALNPDGSSLHIDVRNTGRRLDARHSPGEGIGLDNVGRRLRGCYGDRATLSVRSDRDGATIAALRLPLSRSSVERGAALARGMA